MVEKFKGCQVTIDCGAVLGTFTGTISAVDPAGQTITLSKTTRNQAPCHVPDITLSSRDIKELTILQLATSINSLPHSQESAFQRLLPISPTKPLQEDKKKAVEQHIKRRPSLVRNKSDGGKKWQQHHQKDEDCFNISKASLTKEFDFEKNLALFDKRAVFEEIDAAAREAGGEAPTRLVDSNCRTKYRHDENILESGSPEVEQIILPCGTEKHYVTDSGLLVPSVGLELREKLIKMATECGLSTERLLDMFGRAASEMVLQLLGGCHRLNPNNVHQQPKVVILCGPHLQGTQGITTGRHLANHGVDVTLLISPVPCGMNQHQELNLYRLSGGREASDVAELPQDVDLVVGAMDAHNALSLPVDRALPRWAQACAAPALVLDPPPLPRLTISRPKWCLVPVLPFPYADDLTIYLCDLGIPRDVFQRLGVQYRSPFGSKFLIPLYKISKTS